MKQPLHDLAVTGEVIRSKLTIIDHHRNLEPFGTYIRYSAEARTRQE
jgi:hypothetical protein